MGVRRGIKLRDLKLSKKVVGRPKFRVMADIEALDVRVGERVVFNRRRKELSTAGIFLEPGEVYEVRDILNFPYENRWGKFYSIPFSIWISDNNWANEGFYSVKYFEVVDGEGNVINRVRGEISESVAERIYEARERRRKFEKE